MKTTNHFDFIILQCFALHACKQITSVFIITKSQAFVGTVGHMPDLVPNQPWEENPTQTRQVWHKPCELWFWSKPRHATTSLKAFKSKALPCWQPVQTERSLHKGKSSTLWRQRCSHYTHQKHMSVQMDTRGVYSTSKVRSLVFTGNFRSNHWSENMLCQSQYIK